MRDWKRHKSPFCSTRKQQAGCLPECRRRLHLHAFATFTKGARSVRWSLAA